MRGKVEITCYQLPSAQCSFILEAFPRSLLSHFITEYPNTPVFPALSWPELFARSVLEVGWLVCISIYLTLVLDYCNVTKETTIRQRSLESCLIQTTAHQLRPRWAYDSIAPISALTAHWKMDKCAVSSQVTGLYLGTDLCCLWDHFPACEYWVL